MGFVSRDVELFIVRRLCYSYLLTICHYGNGRSLALGSMVLNVVFYLVPSNYATVICSRFIALAMGGHWSISGCWKMRARRRFINLIVQG